MFYRKHKRVRIDCSQGEGAVQAQRQECDINEIVRRARRDGVVTHLALDAGSYGDFTAVGSYEDAVQLVTQAAERFMELPATLRAKFDNDPEQFLQFAERAEEADWRELGVAAPLEPEASPEASEAAPEPEPGA